MADVQSSTQELVAVYEGLLRLGSELAAYRTLDDLLKSLLRHIGGVASFELIALLLHDVESDSMRVVALQPANLLQLPYSVVPVSAGLTGEVWRRQEPRVAVLRADDALPPALAAARAAGIRVVGWVPVTVPRARLGVLIFGSRQATEYSEHTIELMLKVAGQVAMAIDRTTDVESLCRSGQSLAEERDRAQQLVVEGKRAEETLQLLLRISNAVASELDFKNLLRVISQLLAETIPHHFASVLLWDEREGKLRRHALVFAESQGILREGELVTRGPTPATLAFERGETLVYRWKDIEALGDPALSVMRAERLRSVCCIPLQTARLRHGTLNVGTPDDAAFSAGEVRLLEQIARQLAVAIENAVHFERANRFRLDADAQRDRLKLLLDVNNALVSQFDADSFRLSVLESVRPAVPHEYASLAIFDADSQQLRLESMTYYDERGLIDARVPLSLERSPGGIAFVQRKALVFNDLSAFDADAVPTLRSGGFQSICCLPLITRRRALGTLNVARKSPQPFSAEEVELLRDVAGQVAIAVENAVAFHEISALKDRLTEEKLYLETEITGQHDFKEIIGASPAMTNVLQQVRTVAPTDATVLLLGETGTGKELLARAIHDASRRDTQTFVRVNGAALPAGLIESELFGYEKGAFTGASTSKIGRLELAHRGTLFLDEVGDIPLEVQPKLLRALQEQEFERLGSTRTQRVDVRLIAATNRNLDEMVASGTFRSDLYYRLSVFPIAVPPLRARPDDIPPLVRHFVRKFSRELGRHVTTIPAPVMATLQDWTWPGNIRELQNVIERAVILSFASVLQLPSGIFQSPTLQRITPKDETRLMDTTYRAGERDMILRALRESNGIVAGPGGAAERLGIKRTTLHSKMRKLGIARPAF